MEGRLKSILMLEDNQATIFLHKYLIDKLNCTEELIIAGTGQEAVEILTVLQQEGKDFPELIFVDLNLPGMSGWEFVEAYGRLGASPSGRSKIVLLSNSIDREDHERARENELIDRFLDKPLTKETVGELLDDLFHEL